MRATLPLSLEDENAFTLLLMQAMWGAISPNFRRVSASFSDSTWQILFVLELEDQRDREEIIDIVDNFDGLICGYAPPDVQLATTVVVSAEQLPALDMSKWRLLFQRREAE